MTKALQAKTLLAVLWIVALALLAVGPALSAEQEKPDEATNSDGEPVDTQAGNLQVNSVNIGPILISMMLDGRKFAGKVILVVSAPDNTQIGTLQAGKDAIHSIAYAASLGLFEKGRPDDRQIRQFKANLRKDLVTRFGDAIDQVMVKTLF